MNGFAFQAPGVLAGLLVLIPLYLAYQYGRRKRTALLAAYGGARDAVMHQRIRDRRRSEWCILTAVALLVLALAQPGINPRPRPGKASGRDVVFVLDVSRSMLAADLRPSRLERAKEDIRNCLEALPTDRVGLVIFAGTAAIRCPMTTDYAFLRGMLAEVGPHSVAHGSTYLQSAFEKVADRLLIDDREGFQDIILFTDGEDQGSHPEKVLEVFDERKTRLLVVGYGDPHLGARIPVEADDQGRPRYLEHDDREVWTRLQEKALQDLAAAAPDGVYLRAGGADRLLGSSYRQWAANTPRREREQGGAMQYDEWYAWFLLPALGLLLYPFPGRRRTVLPVVLVLFLLPGGAQGQPVDGEEQALPEWMTALTEEQNPFRLGQKAHRAGLELLHQQRFREAAEAYEFAIILAIDPALQARIRYHHALACAGEAELPDNERPKAGLLHQAVESMRYAVLLRPDWPVASQALEVLYLRRAEADEKEKQRRSSGDPRSGEQEPGEAGELDAFDEDMEYDGEADDSGMPNRSGAMSGAMRSDFVYRALPKPDFSPEDILAEETMNKELRAKKQARKSSGVEKDW